MLTHIEQQGEAVIFVLNMFLENCSKKESPLGRVHRVLHHLKRLQSVVREVSAKNECVNGGMRLKG